LGKSASSSTPAASTNKTTFSSCRMNSAMPPPPAEALGTAFRTPTVKGGANFGFVPQESLFFAVGTRQKVVHKPSKIFFLRILLKKKRFPV